MRETVSARYPLTGGGGETPVYTAAEGAWPLGRYSHTTMAMKALVLASAVRAAAAAAAADASSAAVNLRPESELTGNCFDFPSNHFDRQRWAGSCGRRPLGR